MQLFKYPDEGLFEFINDYDSNKLSNKLNTYLKILETNLGATIDIEDKYEIVQDISATELDKIISVHVVKPENNLDAIYNLEIPTIINSTMVKDRRRFIQKQLRDTLTVLNVEHNYIRILPDVDIEIDIHIKDNNTYFDVKGSASGLLIPLYMYMLGENEENKFLNDENSKEEVVKYVSFDKPKLFKSIATSNAGMRYKRSITQLIAIYSVSPLLHSYASSAHDLLFYAYTMIKNSIPESSVGLDLRNRRVRSVEEIVYGSLMGQFTALLSSDLEMQATSRRQGLVRRIEVTKDLYDFILIENLDSPLANVANKSKVTLTGKCAFKKENVPTRLKMLHSTNYGNIDPAITPDRDGAGVLLYLSSSAKLDEFGRFQELDLLQNSVLQD